ncbi:LOB domain-containing protein 1-like [Neltuma alba]|uniref:LOB domain-containing protein 1-like n=1 Tax=Neltuma alba TaxID=207710 RepID=UPI0010A35AA0|nr:LOB domain-containing protein 1-like [Prosopis alba]XP_028808060.1 LOB domain-containing protein 1-like [Prosopis alba]
MESSDPIPNTPSPTSSVPLSNSPSSSSSPPNITPQVVVSPCAACKILRRRCAEKCVLAPYFPPSEPAKFTIAHRVFGASNIIKFLQELPESQRADAVSSMVYEAGARIRDPVYGCAGAICQLQKQVNELQAQLAKAQAELVNMQLQQANLVALLCMEMAQTTQTDQTHHQTSPTSTPQEYSSPPSSSFEDTNFITSSNLNFFAESSGLNSLWEQPLWI